MTTDDAPSPPDTTPPPRAPTVAPVTAKEAGPRLGIFIGSAAVLVGGAWLMQPAAGLASNSLWGALLGDAWVIGGVRFVGAVAATFLLASIAVLTWGGRWIQRAAGVDAAPRVEGLVERVRVLSEQLEVAEKRKSQLEHLLRQEQQMTRRDRWRRQRVRAASSRTQAEGAPTE